MHEIVRSFSGHRTEFDAEIKGLLDELLRQRFCGLRKGLIAHAVESAPGAAQWRRSAQLFLVRRRLKLLLIAAVIQKPVAHRHLILNPRGVQ